MTTLDRAHVRGYARCPCGQLFPLPTLPGRPPIHCRWHRTREAQRALHRQMGGERN